MSVANAIFLTLVAIGIAAICRAFIPSFDAALSLALLALYRSYRNEGR